MGLNIAYKCVESLQDLALDIETFTEITSRDLKIVKSRLNIKRMVSAVRSKYKFRCKAKGIQLNT
jgi:hypothetical protein